MGGSPQEVDRSFLLGGQKHKSNRGIMADVVSLNGKSPLPLAMPPVCISRLPSRRKGSEQRESMNCKSCRQRKIKCNRIWPTCNACQTFQSPCIYDAVPKKRGPKSEVLQALIRRVDGLEAQLRDQTAGTCPSLSLLSSFPPLPAHPSSPLALPHLSFPPASFPPPSLPPLPVPPLSISPSLPPLAVRPLSIPPAVPAPLAAPPPPSHPLTRPSVTFQDATNSFYLGHSEPLFADVYYTDQPPAPVPVQCYPYLPPPAPLVQPAGFDFGMAAKNNDPAFDPAFVPAYSLRGSTCDGAAPGPLHCHDALRSSWYAWPEHHPGNRWQVASYPAWTRHHA